MRRRDNRNLVVSGNLCNRTSGWKCRLAFNYYCSLPQVRKDTEMQVLTSGLKCLLSMLRCMLGSVKGVKSQNPNVTQRWCYTTAPGTLGDTRHLLDLVSLGTWIEGFKTEQRGTQCIPFAIILFIETFQMSGTWHQTSYGHTNSPIYQFINSSTSVQAKQ